MRNPLKLLVARNPALFYASGNGTLAFWDKQGGGSLTASGALRYQPANGARVNLFKNPSMTGGISGWTASVGGAVSALPTGGVDGTGALQWTGSNSGEGLRSANGSAGQAPISAKVAHIFGFKARVTSGATDYIVDFQEQDAAGGLIASSAATPLTLTASFAAYSVSFTPSGTGTHYICCRLRRASAGASTIEFDQAIFVAASNPTYFDGSTGGVWLDPITGQLGTAHASPSVSQAAFWVEEGTTNVVPDPIFGNATISSFWSPGNAATISRDTTFSYFGQASGKATFSASTNDSINQSLASAPAAASGQTWTSSWVVRANSAANVGKLVKIGIGELDSGHLGLTESTSGNFTLTDTWQRITFIATLGNASTAFVRTRLINAQAAACVVNVDGVQLEQKSYATSLCAGSLGTGYTWSGTAHASSSTRAAATLNAASTPVRVDSQQGALFALFARLVDTGANQVISNFGNNTSGHDAQALNVIGADDKIKASFASNGGGGVQIDSGQLATIGQFYSVLHDWAGRSQRISVNGGAPVSGARNAAAGDATNQVIGIGYYNVAGSNQLDGLIGPVAIFSRPLTDAELAKVIAAAQNGTLSFDTLKALS